MTPLQEIGKAAKKAAQTLSAASEQVKNTALENIALMLAENTEKILAENKKDLARAAESGMNESLIDRLTLTKERIEKIAEGVREVIALKDPIGELLEEINRPNGLIIKKIRVPLGVIGIIYESRPNVTVDAAILCLKCGNPVVLRGGKEAIHSNLALCAVMRAAIKKAGLPEDAVTVLSDTSRETAGELMRMNQYIDVLIPRGGASLIKTVCENATVPVIETGVGNCHTYIDSRCDTEMALRIVVNAKCQRPSVCNAMETLLIHADMADSLLPKIGQAMENHHTEIRGCEKTRSILQNATAATEEDYATEYNDYILTVKVVSSTEEAIAHIARYGSAHSEAIVTDIEENAALFLQLVDAAAVYHNAATRFTDGYEFGLGAEIGISTQKMHARGPMGLRELTSCKYLVLGTGQIR